MRQRLTSVDVESFLKRHSQFYDGVIKKAELAYVSPLRLDLDVHVEVQDNETPSGWCRLRLKFEDVRLFHVAEGPGTNVVMSPEGAHIFFDDHFVYADLSPVTDPMMDEMADRLICFSESSFAVKAEAVWFETTPVE